VTENHNASSETRRSFLGMTAAGAAGAVLGGLGFDPLIASAMAQELKRSEKPLKAAFSKKGRVMGVSMKVGPTLLTRTLCGASSMAMALVKPSMACLEVQ